MVEYPEHNKLHAVRDRSEAIGEFLEWLRGQRVNLMVWREDIEDTMPCSNWNCIGGEVRGKPCPFCNGTGQTTYMRKEWWPLGKTIEGILAEYFDVDLDKLEAEKRAMLDGIRMADARERE